MILILHPGLLRCDPFSHSPRDVTLHWGKGHRSRDVTLHWSKVHRPRDVTLHWSKGQRPRDVTLHWSKGQRSRDINLQSVIEMKLYTRVLSIGKRCNFILR